MKIAKWVTTVPNLSLMYIYFFVKRLFLVFVFFLLLHVFDFSIFFGLLHSLAHLSRIYDRRNLISTAMLTYPLSIEPNHRLPHHSHAGKLSSTLGWSTRNKRETLFENIYRYRMEWYPIIYLYPVWDNKKRGERTENEERNSIESN